MSTPYLDRYIDINYIHRAPSGTIYIYYYMKQNYTNTSIPLLIGYEWPAEYSGALPSKYIRANYNQGFHVAILPPPPAFAGRLKIYAKINAYRYNEAKYAGSLFHAPAGKTVRYHTITRSEAFQEWAILAAPGVVFEFLPSTKMVKVFSRLYLGWALWSGFAGAINFPNTMPPAQAGQYVKTTTWYENFRLNTNVKIWSSKEAFDLGVRPIFDGTGYYQF